jgi:hypothetical protein
MPRPKELHLDWRVLTEDSSEGRKCFGEGFQIVVQMVVEFQRKVDHFLRFRHNFGAAAKAGEKIGL